MNKYRKAAILIAIPALAYEVGQSLDHSQYFWAGFYAVLACILFWRLFVEKYDLDYVKAHEKYSNFYAAENVFEDEVGKIIQTRIPRRGEIILMFPDYMDSRTKYLGRWSIYTGDEEDPDITVLYDQASKEWYYML